MYFNNKGIGLVEVMVAAGLMGALALMGSQLHKNQTRAQKTVERNYEVAAILSEIRNVLSNPDSCSATFGGVNFSNGSVSVLRKDVQGVLSNVFPVNTALSNGVSINSYRLNNSSTNLAADETALVISFMTGKATLREEVTKNLKLSFTSSGSNILRCYASANKSDQFWIQSTSNMDDIYYSAGRIGIGTGSPQAPLHIQGNGPLIYESYGSSAEWLLKGSSGTSSTPSAVSNNAEIGRIGFSGYNGSSWQTFQAGMSGVSSQAWASGAHGTHLLFHTNANNSAGSLERMRITSEGRIGIGSVLPTTTLTVDPNLPGGLSATIPVGWGGVHTNDVYANSRIGVGTNGAISAQMGSDGVISAANFRYTSDKKLKKHVAPIENPLRQLLKLQGRRFVWKENNSPDIGFIAQDVEMIFPELVHANEQGLKMVSYGNITAVTVEAIKELKKENDELKKRIMEIEKFLKSNKN